MGGSRDALATPARRVRCWDRRRPRPHCRRITLLPCHSPAVPSRIRQIPPILSPVLPFAPFVVNTSLETTMHLAPAHASPGVLCPALITLDSAFSPAPDSLFAIRHSHFFASSRGNLALATFEHCQPCAGPAPTRNRSPTPPAEHCQPGGARAGNVGNLGLPPRERTPPGHGPPHPSSFITGHSSRPWPRRPTAPPAFARTATARLRGCRTPGPR
jgi:hypothetical protein